MEVDKLRQKGGANQQPDIKVENDKNDVENGTHGWAYSRGWSRIRLLARYRFIPLQTREVPGKCRRNGVFAVLDLTLVRIVNGTDCRVVVKVEGGARGTSL